MDEGRKRTLGVIAAIFICRKLDVLEGKSSPAREMAFKKKADQGFGSRSGFCLHATPHERLSADSALPALAWSTDGSARG